MSIKLITFILLFFGYQNFGVSILEVFEIN